jgi:hypothetical protein
MDHRRLEYFFKRIHVSELTIWVVGTMAVVLFSNFCKLLKSSSKLVHVLLARICEQPDCERYLIVVPKQFLVTLKELFHWLSAIVPEELQGTSEHLVKPERQHAV